MNLREEILKEHSKAQCNKIVEWVGADQKRFDILFHLFLNDEYQVTQRAAWPLSYCVSAHPHFINKKFADLINNLSRPDIHHAVKRNTLRILQDIDIPDKYQGKVMNVCFNYLASPNEPVARVTLPAAATVVLSVESSVCLVTSVVPLVSLVVDSPVGLVDAS